MDRGTGLVENTPKAFANSAQGSSAASTLGAIMGAMEP